MVAERPYITAHGRGAPEQLPPGSFPATLVVALKADDARGRYPVTLKIQQPSGVYLPDQTFDAMFEGDERGVNLILEMAMEAIEGLYWFEIFVNDRMLTRVPFRVIYQ